MSAEVFTTAEVAEKFAVSVKTVNRWRRAGRFPGAFPVQVVEVEPDKRIVLKWGGDDDGSVETTVTIRFESTEDDRTIVSISEEGWPKTEDGLKNSYGNCMGWSQMICAMKAWVEHGINLREGMYA